MHATLVLVAQVNIRHRQLRIFVTMCEHEGGGKCGRECGNGQGTGLQAVA